MSIAALPRPVLLGIVGVVLVGGVFVATRKPSTTSSSPSTPAPAIPAAKAPAAKAPSATPSKPNPATASKPAHGTPGLPAPVQGALDAHKVVVVLFWNKSGFDDRSVKASLGSVSRRHGKIAVFTDQVGHLSRYSRIITAASISTTPALVIVNRKGQAEVVNGYLDRQTIAQYVQNALKR